MDCPFSCKVMTDSPIKPPSLAIIKKWIIANGLTVSIVEASAIASLASRLGADQELEACCEWLDWQNLATHSDLIPSLRAARRPKAPSLKEQALEAMDRCDNEIWCEETERDLAIIRTALEQLND